MILRAWWDAYVYFLSGAPGLALICPCTTGECKKRSGLVVCAYTRILLEATMVLTYWNSSLLTGTQCALEESYMHYCIHASAAMSGQSMPERFWPTPLDLPCCQCRILVSSARKPISYINLAKRFLSEHGEVQLSALGIAIAPAVTVAEILKSRGLALDKHITTALESLADENRYVCGLICLVM